MRLNSLGALGPMVRAGQTGPECLNVFYTVEQCSLDTKGIRNGLAIRHGRRAMPALSITITDTYEHRLDMGLRKGI